MFVAGFYNLEFLLEIAMLMEIEKCQMTFIWLVRLGPTNDRLFARNNNEMRSIETTIKSWHATCRISAVSKILDWLVQ